MESLIVRVFPVEWRVARPGDADRVAAEWTAQIGPDHVEGIAGFGPTPSAALRNLADMLEREPWVVAV